MPEAERPASDAYQQKTRKRLAGNNTDGNSDGQESRIDQTIDFRVNYPGLSSTLQSAWYDGCNRARCNDFASC